MSRIRVVLLVLFVLAVLASPFWVSAIVWQAMPWRTERVQLVDYSVPFVSGREHSGAIWVLNHFKYRPPSDDRWKLVGSHAGYDPTDRDHPRPISSLDLSRTDWLVVTDAYGVYKDDLEQIALERAHMDYSERIFGGLSDADAQAIAALSARGGHVLLEFNAIEEPTTPAARARIEALFGITWTGWVGRTFIDLRDTLDVPRWLPREYLRQYGDDRMPLGPALAMVHRDGRLRIISDPVPERVAPVIELTARGTSALPHAEGGGGYPYWFPVLTAHEGTEVLAEFLLPSLRVMDSLRAAEGIPLRIPMLTRRTDGGAHRIYLAADLSDAGFPTGRYAFAGLARYRAATQAELTAATQSPERDFWQFYVPALRALLGAPRREPRQEPRQAPRGAPTRAPLAENDSTR